MSVLLYLFAFTDGFLYPTPHACLIMPSTSSLPLPFPCPHHPWACVPYTHHPRVPYACHSRAVASPTSMYMHARVECHAGAVCTSLLTLGAPHILCTTSHMVDARGQCRHVRMRIGNAPYTHHLVVCQLMHDAVCVPCMHLLHTRRTRSHMPDTGL